MTIQYTETFENSVSSAVDHLSQWEDPSHVNAGIMSVIETFEINVSQNPNMYVRCPELVSLGVTSVREYKSAGYRLLYEVRDNQVIIGLLLLRQKQDITMALIDYCLIYK